jgi:glycosyltransferase involved in cell wall biosynthesis
MARVCMIALTRYDTDARVRREAEALVERGDQVDFLCLATEGQQRASTVNGVRLYRLWIPRYRGTNGLRYVAQYAVFFVLAAAMVSWLHLRRRYDVVEVHTMPDFMVFTAVLPKLMGAKVLLDVHDLAPELYASKFGSNDSHWMTRVLEWIERQSVRFADRAMAVHDPHLDALVRHGNPREKFDVLLNVPDEAFFSRRPSDTVDDSTFKVVYHGVVAPRHGLETAVRALARVRDELGPVELLILGDGDGVARIEQLVSDLDLHGIVHVGGLVPLEKLVPLIGDADLAVVPLLEDGFTRYMLPVKLLEYVTLGIPVVCSDTETIRRYFDDSMLAFFPSWDEVALSARLVELHRDPEARRALVRRAATFAETHSWRQEKLRYYRTIDALVRG